MLRQLLFWLCCATPAFLAQNLPAPTKQPAAQSPVHRKLILDGIQLHDLGDYPGAMRKYEQVLAENPNDVAAMYELSHTLMAAKDYRRCLEVAKQGASYETRLLPDFYAAIGSALDELGDQRGAISVYKHGIKLFRDSAVLPFNLGVTYSRLGQPEDARQAYQAALRADPAHTSSHYRLAALYAEHAYEIPAILAYLRFLELAQDVQRCRQALQFVVGRLMGAATSGSRPDEINVTINMASSKTDEGDFTGPAAVIGLGAVLRFTEEGKKMTRPQLVLHQTEMLFESFENNKDLRKEKKKFAAAMYATYFRELHKAKHTEAFAYSILRQSGWPEVADWLEKHPDETKAYAQWAAVYAWPVGKTGGSK